MALNDRPDLSDDALRGFLEARSEKAGTDGLLASVRAEAAATRQRRPARLHLGFLQGLAAGAAGVVALGALAIVVALALGSTAPKSPIGATASEVAPSFGPSTGPPATPVIPGAVGPVLPLTIDQLNSILLPNSTALLGRLLVIDATIVENPELARRHLPSASPPAFTGPPAILQGSIPILGVEIAAAASLPGPMPWTGTFAARMIDARTIEYLEPVTRGLGGGPLKPSQLSSLSALTRASGYVLVQGWIAGFDVPIPCPPPLVTPPPGPQYSGCAVTSSLSDSSAQPVSGTTFHVPDDGVQVQDRAYDDFAPDPQLINQGTEPELATFLVMPVYETTCAPGDFCPFQPLKDYWQIVARIDPWPTLGETAPPTGAPTPSPTASPPAVQPVQPLTVAQLNTFMAMNSQSPEGRQLVITGTIAPMPLALGPNSHACEYVGGSWTCPPAYLVGSNPRLAVQPVGDVGPGPWEVGAAQLTGTFAATLHGFTLSYQAAVSTNTDGGPWLPGQLPSASETSAGSSSWLVQGWIASLPIDRSCPVGETPYPGPQYTCGQQSTLSDSAYDAQTSVGANDLPHTLRVQNGAYVTFAPQPVPNHGGYAPEQGTFLLRVTYIPACGPTIDCLIPPSNDHWAIVARIDPWPLLPPPALP